MWYKIESLTVVVYFSEDLIAINPDLTTNLCAELLTRLLRVSYWELLKLFRSCDSHLLRKHLAKFSLVEEPNFIDLPCEGVVGCLLQKPGRKNITNTYFSFDGGSLAVTKTTENTDLRRSISNEKVLSGSYLHPELSDLINKNDVKGFEALFVDAITSVFEIFKSPLDNKLLKPEAIDCIPKNIIITDCGFNFFDIEYEPDIVLTKSHFLFRCAIGFDKRYIKKGRWPYKSPFDLYMILCSFFKIIPDVESDIRSELVFREDILEAGSKGLSYKELSMGFYNEIPLAKKISRYLVQKLKIYFYAYIQKQKN